MNPRISYSGCIVNCRQHFTVSILYIYARVDCNDRLVLRDSVHGLLREGRPSNRLV